MRPRWLSLRPVAPDDWADLPPRFVTEVLREEHPRAKVKSISVVEQDDGTNRHACISLGYSRGSGPRRLFLKSHARSHRWVHFRNGNLWNEARLNFPLKFPRFTAQSPIIPGSIS